MWVCDKIKAPRFSVVFPSGPAMRKLVSILSPVYWTTAKEIGEAMNGFTLTDAVFKRETQVEFATGELPGIDQLFLCPVSRIEAAFLKRQQRTIAEI